MPPDPFYFVKDLEKFYRKSYGCINPCKKVLESKKVIFKISIKLSVISKNPKAAKIFMYELEPEP